MAIRRAQSSIVAVAVVASGLAGCGGITGKDARIVEDFNLSKSRADERVNRAMLYMGANDGDNTSAKNYLLEAKKDLEYWRTTCAAAPTVKDWCEKAYDAELRSVDVHLSDYRLLPPQVRKQRKEQIASKEADIQRVLDTLGQGLPEYMELQQLDMAQQRVDDAVRTICPHENAQFQGICEDRLKRYNTTIAQRRINLARPWPPRLPPAPIATAARISLY